MSQKVFDAMEQAKPFLRLNTVFSHSYVNVQRNWDSIVSFTSK